MFLMKVLGYNCLSLSSDLERFLNGIQFIAVIHAGRGLIPFFPGGAF